MAAQGKLEFAALAHSKSGQRNRAGDVGVDVFGAGKSRTDTFDTSDPEIPPQSLPPLPRKREFTRRRFWIPAFAGMTTAGNGH